MERCPAIYMGALSNSLWRRARAHWLLNRGESVVRALFLSTTGLPANVYYPDTGHWLIRNGSPG